MSQQMEDLMLARANELAEADGSPLGTVYVVAAANALQVDLLAARDRLLRPGAEIIVEPAPVAVIVSEESAPAVLGEAAPQPAVLADKVAAELPAAEPEGSAEPAAVPAGDDETVE